MRKVFEVKDNVNDNSRLKDDAQKPELLNSIIGYDSKYNNAEVGLKNTEVHIKILRYFVKHIKNPIKFNL